MAKGARGGKNISIVGGGGGVQAPKKTTISEHTAENLKTGDIISPNSDEKWSITINNEVVRGEVNDYITVDSVKVSGKTVKITGHYDQSGYFPVGSKEYEAGKKRITKVTKVVKKDASFKVKR